MTTAVKISVTRMGFSKLSFFTFRRETSRSYLSGLMAWLALPPMMRRFMEKSASWVRIPARIAGMPMTVWNRPVTAPAIMPAINAQSMATQTLTPWVMRMMQTAPPVHMVPSTVRSARSSTLNVMYTPMAIRPQIRPWASAPGRALSREGKKFTVDSSCFLSSKSQTDAKGGKGVSFPARGFLRGAA